MILNHDLDKIGDEFVNVILVTSDVGYVPVA